MKFGLFSMVQVRTHAFIGSLRPIDLTPRLCLPRSRSGVGLSRKKQSKQEGRKIHHLKEASTTQ